MRVNNVTLVCDAGGRQARTQALRGQAQEPRAKPAVVHNGIIEKAEALREQLAARSISSKPGPIPRSQLL